MASTGRDFERRNDGPSTVVPSFFALAGGVALDPAMRALRDLILFERVPAGERHIETLADPGEDSFGFDLPWIQTHEEAARTHLREAVFPLLPDGGGR